MSAVGRVLAWVVLTPIAVLVVGIGGCEAREAYYDWQVRKLCEKEGGVTVLENVIVTPEQVATLPRHGAFLSVSQKLSAKPLDPVFLTTTVTYLLDSDVVVARSESHYVARRDNRRVATVVFYSRRGGDFPSLAHPSSFSCPAGDDDAQGIASIYQIQEKAK